MKPKKPIAAPAAKRALPKKAKAQTPPPNPYEKEVQPARPGPHCTFGCFGNPTAPWENERGETVQVCVKECSWLAKRRQWKQVSS